MNSFEKHFMKIFTTVAVAMVCWLTYITYHVIECVSYNNCPKIIVQMQTTDCKKE